MVCNVFQKSLVKNSISDVLAVGVYLKILELNNILVTKNEKILLSE
jgi:hypothetical protein